LEVFNLIGQSQPTGQIAKRLSLSVSTIETYRQRLKEKLGLKNAGELARCAVCWVEGSQHQYHI
jgi:DNA-binding CsgD family transcriptional regulator